VSDDRRVLSRLRRYLLAILAVGSVGAGVELLLLGHVEGVAQIVPLLLLGVGIPVIGWCAAAGSPASTLALRATMAMFVVSGGLGIALHYQGNVEFEREMYPSLAGMELVSKTLTGATPVLAPGTMALFGVMGLLAVYGFRR
jgi:hypothetical protein